MNCGMPGVVWSATAFQTSLDVAVGDAVAAKKVPRGVRAVHLEAQLAALRGARVRPMSWNIDAA
jgi:hypothetical protein